MAERPPGALQCVKVHILASNAILPDLSQSDPPIITNIEVVLAPALFWLARNVPTEPCTE